MPESKKNTTENKAILAGKKTVKVYLILAVIFSLIFGGLTLLAFFISRLSS
jgi:hypothetical protein